MNNNTVYCWLSHSLSHTDWHWSSFLGTACKSSMELQALGGNLVGEVGPLPQSDYCQLQVNTELKIILEETQYTLKYLKQTPFMHTKLFKEVTSPDIFG